MLPGESGRNAIDQTAAASIPCDSVTASISLYQADIIYLPRQSVCVATSGISHPVAGPPSASDGGKKGEWDAAFEPRGTRHRVAANLLILPFSGTHTDARLFPF